MNRSFNGMTHIHTDTYARGAHHTPTLPANRLKSAGRKNGWASDRYFDYHLSPFAIADSQGKHKFAQDPNVACSMWTNTKNAPYCAATLILIRAILCCSARNSRYTKTKIVFDIQYFPPRAMSNQHDILIEFRSEFMVTSCVV